MFQRRDKRTYLGLGLTLLAVALALVIALPESNAVAGLPAGGVPGGHPSGSGPSAKDAQSGPVAPGGARQEGATSDIVMDGVHLRVPPARSDPSAIGDLLFGFNAEAASGDNVLLGTEYTVIAGTPNFWVTGRSNVDNIKQLHKFDGFGNFLSSTTQDACASSTFGWRDLAFDGSFLWTADECGVDKIDPADGSRVGGFVTPAGQTLVRALAYDPGTAHFYSANFNSSIFIFDTTGAPVGTPIPANGLAHYGFGWDAVTGGGPYLWSFAQNNAIANCAAPNNCLRATQLSPTTGLPTGVSFDGTPAFPANNAEVAGGADVDVVSGTLTLVTLHQAFNDMVMGYSLSGAVNTPTASPTVTPTPVCTPPWTAQATYPSLIMDHAGASQGSFVYTFGGYTGSAVVTNSYKYNTSTNTWSAIAGLPAARQAPRAVSDGTYIYIVGGWDTAGTATNTLYRYDPVADSYTTMAPFTQGASAAGVALLSGKIYKIGGCADSACTRTNVVEAYTISSNTWATVAAYPTSTSWLMAVGLSGFVYAAGGIDSDTTATNKTYRYDPGSDSWNDAAIPDLPDDTRWAAASDQFNGTWLLAGGVVANFSAVTNSALQYDPVGNTWTSIDPMLVARYRMAGGTTGTGAGAQFYAVGGSSGGFNATNNNQRYQPVPCIFTPTNTPTRTNTLTRTVTPTVANTRTPTPTFCPPVLRSIGPGDPGKPGTAIRPANAQTNLDAAAGGGKSVRAGKLPDNPSNASAAFELDDGTRETSIGFGSTVSNTESAAIWLNRFSPPNGAYPITLNQVHILWPAQSPTLTDTIIGKTARLLIYRANAAGAPITNTTLIYQQMVTVGVTETFQTYNLTSPPTIAGVNGEDLYIGFEDFWAESGNFQPRFFPAAEDTTPPSQVRSWVVGNSDGDAPNVGDLGNPTNDTVGTIDSFGLPGNWMIRASGSTSLPDPCPATRTPTPVATPRLVVHILFQGIPTPNPVKYITDTVTTTLRLASGGPNIEYAAVGPDGFGFYTIPVGTLPNGTYIIRAKGHKNLSNGTTSCDTVVLTGALITQVDLANGGTTPLRAGDALPTGVTNFNVVNASDFTTLKTTFGKAFGQAGYDERADFNQTDNVDASDFSLQKGNFGSAGCPNP